MVKKNLRSPAKTGQVQRETITRVNPCLFVDQKHCATTSGRSACGVYRGLSPTVIHGAALLADICGVNCKSIDVGLYRYFSR